MKKINRIANQLITTEIIQHLEDAIKEKSLFDLSMAANLIENNREKIRDSFGWDPLAVVGLYADVEGYFKQNEYNEKNDKLPNWCIDPLIDILGRISFKTNTMDAIDEAEEKLNKRDKEVEQIKKEIDVALDNKDEEKFKELSDRLKKIESKKKRLKKI